MSMDLPPEDETLWQLGDLVQFTRQSGAGVIHLEFTGESGIPDSSVVVIVGARQTADFLDALRQFEERWS